MKTRGLYCPISQHDRLLYDGKAVAVLQSTLYVNLVSKSNMQATGKSTLECSLLKAMKVANITSVVL